MLGRESSSGPWDRGCDLRSLVRVRSERERNGEVIKQDGFYRSLDQRDTVKTSLTAYLPSEAAPNAGCVDLGMK